VLTYEQNTELVSSSVAKSIVNKSGDLYASTQEARFTHYAKKFGYKEVIYFRNQVRLKSCAKRVVT